MSETIKNKVVVNAVFYLALLLFSTLRPKIIGSTSHLLDDKNKIFALWHGRFSYVGYVFRNRPNIHVLISSSRDGEFLASLTTKMGFSTIRGSSFKRPVAASRRIVAKLLGGESLMIAADGSRGPNRRAQAGPIHLARISGASIIPVTFGIRRKWTMNSWDKFIVPLPFARCTVNIGEPIPVPADLDDAEVPAYVEKLEAVLNRMTDSCDGLGD